MEKQIILNENEISWLLEILHTADNQQRAAIQNTKKNDSAWNALVYDLSNIKHLIAKLEGEG